MCVRSGNFNRLYIFTSSIVVIIFLILLVSINGIPTTNVNNKKTTKGLTVIGDEVADNNGMHNLTCSLVGEPETSVVQAQWTKNGNKLDEGTVTSHDLITNKFTLHNIAATKKTANYTCIVSTQFGTGTNSFLIGGNIENKNTVIVWVITGTCLLLFCLMAFLTLLHYLAQRKLTEEMEQKCKLLVDNDPPGVDSSKLQEDIILTKLTYEELAAGRYGTVYKYEPSITLSDDTRINCVLKTFNWPIHWSHKQARLVCNDLLEEAKILQQLHRNSNERHPNIVRYIGLFTTNTLHFRIYIVLEFCTRGNLLKYLELHEENKTFCSDIINEKFLPDDRIRKQNDSGKAILGTSHLIKWTLQIASAMKYIHGMKIVHRDLATRNILLKVSRNAHSLNSNQLISIDDLIVQISDYGMARQLPSHTGSYIIQDASSKRDQKPRYFPVRWYPPEVLESGLRSYSLKSDVWSYGVLIWEMFSLGTEPYTNEIPDSKDLIQKLIAFIRNGNRLEQEDLPLEIPNKLWKVMNCCWNNNPNRRPDLATVHDELEIIVNETYELYSDGFIRETHLANHANAQNRQQIDFVERRDDNNASVDIELPIVPSSLSAIPPGYVQERPYNSEAKYQGLPD